MLDKIVFSYWDTVIYDDKEESVANFLKDIELKFKTEHKADSFAVFFDEDNKKFFISIDGKKYEVVFQEEVQEKLNNGEYNSLILKLINLAGETKRLLDEDAIKKTKEEVIERINNSNYEELEKPEYYQLYLDYLEEKLSKTDNEEERRLIDTKIANIIKMFGETRKSNSRVMVNPIERKYNVISYLDDLLEKIESLDQKDRVKIAKEVKKIVNDYKKLQNNKVKGKVKDDFVLPLDILNRISELEQKISLLIPERKDFKEGDIMNKTINFTRLNTIKSNDFEFTREIFYSRLKEYMSLGNNDVIIYDKETDSYKILYDGCLYNVYYDNKELHSDCIDNSIINELNELIEYQTLQKELNKKKEEYKVEAKNAINNGKRGIFKNDNDKVIFIKYLKKELDELKENYKNYPFLDKECGVSSFMDIFDKSPNFVAAFACVRFIILLVVTVTLILVTVLSGGILLIPTLVSVFISAFAFLNGFGLSSRVISIILPIILMIKYLIARGKNKKKVKEKINQLIKKITPLEKSLSDPTLLLKEEVFKVEEKNKEVSEETYETIKNMIYQLRDKIVLVKDHNKKNKFGNELTQIIDFERMINKNNKSINPQDIINQLKRLSYQVEKEINEKERIDYNNKACDEIVEECSKVISKSL